MMDEGYVIRKYKGRGGDERLMGFRLSIDFFLFLFLCYDLEGNLVVVSFVDGLFYLLFFNGDFCGFIENIIISVVYSLIMFIFFCVIFYVDCIGCSFICCNSNIFFVICLILYMFFRMVSYVV